MSLPTGSNIQRAMACPASCALPQVKTGGTAYSERGTLLHRFVELKCKQDEEGAEGVLAQLSGEDAALARSLRLSKLVPKQAEYEVALAWNATSGLAKTLGYGLDRAYPKVRSDTFVGTVDVMWTKGSTVHIRDWKFGSHEVPPPEKNWQLKFGALAACRALGVKTATGAIWQPDDEGGVINEPFEYREKELVETEEALRDLVSRIAASAEAETPDVQLGDHCRYCPALAACPGQTAIVRELVSLDVSDKRASKESLLARLTPETAAQAHQKLQLAWQALYLFQDVLTEYVSEQEKAGTPVQTEAGVLRLVNVGKEMVKDHELASKTLLSHGRELVGLAVEPHTSKTAILAACKELDLDPDEIFEELREAGALARNETLRVKEVLE